MHVIYSLFISHREVKKKSDALVSLSDIFYIPRFINPIFKIGEWINSMYDTHVFWILSSVAVFPEYESYHDENMPM